MTVSRKLARPLMSSIFFVGPVTTLRNSSDVAKRAEPVTGQIARWAQRAGVPLNHDPELMVKINAGVQLVGAAALATGRCPRAAAGLLAVTLVPTTLAGHRFWEETDPAARAQQRLQFAKNLSLFGGLIVAAMDTDGKPGKAWLAKQAAKGLTKKADALATTAKLEAKVAALEAAGAGDTLTETLTTAGKVARERAQDLAHDLGDRLSEKAPEWAATAGTAGAIAAAKSQDLGSRLAEKASEKAPEWAAAGRSAGAVAAAKAPEWAAAGRSTGTELLARSQGVRAQAADALGDASKQGRVRAKELHKQARSTAKDLRKELRGASKDARKEMAKQAKKARKNADVWKASAQREVAKAKAKVA